MEPVCPENTAPASCAVSAENALACLQAALESSGDGTRSAVRTAQEVQTLYKGDVRQTRAADGEGGGPLAYVVNFDEGGYAIMGADMRQAPVVAVVDCGSITPERLAASKLAADSGAELDTPAYIDALVVAYLESALDTAPESRIIGGFPTTWETVESCSPLLMSQWGQRAPLNRFCIDMNGRQAPAGCGAIAVAQVMAYNAWKYNKQPDRIVYKADAVNTLVPNWDAIREAAAGKALTSMVIAREEDVAWFVRAVGGAIGTFYHPAGSVCIMSGICDYLSVCGGGYRNAVHVRNPKPNELGNYVKSMVYQKRLPVLFGASDNSIKDKQAGHVWVLDGWAYQRSKSSFQSPGTPTRYFYRHAVHCNFGWKGEHDGLYEAGVFNNLSVDGTTYNFRDGHELVIYDL